MMVVIPTLSEGRGAVGGLNRMRSGGVSGASYLTRLSGAGKAQPGQQTEREASREWQGPAERRPFVEHVAGHAS